MLRDDDEGPVMREDQERISDIYERHRPGFLGFVRRRLKDVSQMDAEDIVADVFFTLFNKADLTGRVEDLTAYIYRSIANKMADYRRRYRPVISLDYTDSEVDVPLRERLVDPSADAEKAVGLKDARERLYEAIAQLEPRQRAVWIATEIEGRTFKELSQSWDEPIGTLLSRKSRAARALRAMLKDLDLY